MSTLWRLCVSITHQRSILRAARIIQNMKFEIGSKEEQADMSKYLLDAIKLLDSESTAEALTAYFEYVECDTPVHTTPAAIFRFNSIQLIVLQGSR